MRIAIITAGAAGMFCGSCMRDNTLATALIALGHDALLIPTYTPITTDEVDATVGGRVHFGGVNVFLQQSKFTSWLFRRTPRFVDAAFNNLAFLRWVGRFAGGADYGKLGGLTISMLRGTEGNQRKEVAKLVGWLKAEVRPEIVLISNALLSGIVPTLSRELNVPILTTLQGDDIFLEQLSAKDRERAIGHIRANHRFTAGYICTSIAYADFMSGYLAIDRANMHVVYPGISTKGHAEPALRPTDRPPAIGFFARLAPEKGFHNLVDAFIHLRTVLKVPGVKLKYAGWLGKQSEAYHRAQRAKLDAAGLADDTEWVMAPDLASKSRFYRSIDVLSVPTDYREPKGLYVLEAMAHGVPVVQPAHGSFPELIARTGGGMLVPPNDIPALAGALATMLADHTMREAMGRAGYDGVKRSHEARHMAEETVAVLEKYLPGGRA